MIGQLQEAWPDAEIADATSERDSGMINNLVAEDLSEGGATNSPGTEKNENARYVNNLLHIQRGLAGECFSESETLL